MEVKEPKITIITPSFNQGRYIEQTIRSVINQQYRNLEYIIIDGGSTDGTVDIIKKYEKHITYWVSERDNGQSDAINKGLQLATGEIVNWLNSDDYYECGALDKVAEAFQDPNTKVVCGRSRIFHNDNPATYKYSRGTDVFEGNLPKTIGWARIDQPETFFRRTAIEVMGYLNPSLHYVMDKEWWIRFLLVFGLSGIRKIEDILVNFRVHDNSKTGSEYPKFESETAAIFNSIADWSEAKAEQEALKKLAGEQYLAFLMPTDFSADIKNTIQAALHYYLLNKADVHYYRHERELAGLCLKAIEERYLLSEDRKLYRKLNFRNKFYPAQVAKLVRR